MKPRNALQKELQQVIDSGKLKPLTPKQMQQAHDIMNTNKRFRLFVFNTEQTIKGMKLTKCYKVHRYGRGEIMTYYHLCLIRAEKDGEVAWAARHCNIGFIDSFSHEGDLTIKQGRWWYEGYINHNDVLRSTGKSDKYAIVRSRCHNQFEFRDSRVETIAKCGEEGIIQTMMTQRRALPSYMFAAFKVANRHHYRIGGNWQWCELVEMLHHNKMDYRNPHYICPDNIELAYQNMIDINDRRLLALQKKRDKEAYEARIRQEKLMLESAMKYDKTYVKEHKKWLGIVIVGRGIQIKPLQSVKEFQEEGAAMHHCVFSCQYYKKSDSLILSARDESGKRLATIEYDTKNSRLLQCRAACNQQPKDYDKICRLVRRHMNKLTTKIA